MLVSGIAAVGWGLALYYAAKWMDLRDEIAREVRHLSGFYENTQAVRQAVVCRVGVLERARRPNLQLEHQFGGWTNDPIETYHGPGPHTGDPI